MQSSDIALWRRPSLFLPCPHCGHRMAITAVTPTRFDSGNESSELEDVTHGCAECGTTLTRTIRPPVGDGATNTITSRL
jgi:DNA-directed RNA polymerase subunit RPC12/RpoP